MPDLRLKKAIEALVAEIPRGRLMTYGQIATLLGQPRRARAVGWTAHWGNPDLPWQRVVNRNGRVAPGWPGGMLAHAEALRAEGIEVDDGWTADLDRYQWEPSDDLLRKIAPQTYA